MARIGYLYLRGGEWNGMQIIPRKFVEAAGRSVKPVVGLPEVDQKNHGNASDHYGLLWWNNADGTLANVPRDAYWSWGLYDSLIVVFPSLDLVVARAGRSWKRTRPRHYDVLEPFFDPIVASVIEDKPRTGVGTDTRFGGGLAIYDAPQPWGPWTTVFFTPKWDVGPGDTSCLPTKWMSRDGRTVHLVFSGNDCFSVRKATLLTGE